MYYDENKKSKKNLLFLIIGIVLLIFIIIIVKIATGKKSSEEPNEEDKLACELEVTDGVAIGNNIYAGEVEISFKSKSPSSVRTFGIGTAKTYNGRSAYTLSKEGETTVYGYVKDLNGKEATCEIKITVKPSDSLSCTLGVKSGTKGENDWYKSDVEVEFKTKGNEDTKITKFGITGYDANTEEDEVKIDYNNKEGYVVTKEGITDVYGKIEDDAGNIAECKLIVKKAATNPTCSLKVTSGTKNGDYYKSDVKVEMDSATKTTAEISKKGVGVSKTYESTSYTVTKEGTTKVYGYVMDDAGNENTCELSITKNTSSTPPNPSAPTPTCSLKVSNGTKGANDWYNTNVTVTFESGGSNSSVGIGTSKIYNGQKTYTITNDGTTTIYGYVKNSSNKEGTCSITIKKDSTNPNCSLKVTKASCSGTCPETAYNVEFIDKSDSTSGLNAFGIGTGKNYDGQSVYKTTAYNSTIYGYTKDNAGNESTCNIKIPEDDANPNLSSVASIGDYVAYDAGSWAETKAYPTTTTEYQFKFGGYNTGQSRNQGVNCESKTANGLSGWRILSISGSTVTLIHAGTPECYYHPAISGQTNLAYNSESILKGSTGGSINQSYTSTPRNWGNYVNSTYAQGATVFTKQMLDTFKGTTIASGTTLNDSILKTNVIYYLGSAMNTGALWGISNSGYVTGYSYRVFGVRPVVTLKAAIKTTGKNASGAWTLTTQ